MVTSLTKCSTGTTGVSTTIELKNLRTAFDGTGTLVSQNTSPVHAIIGGCYFLYF